MESSSTAAVVVAADAVQRKKRQQRSVAEKRQIVEETLIDGASVAQVARERGVNANQVFAWRRLYQAGRLIGRRRKAITPNPARLLPVKVSEGPEPAAIATPDATSLLAQPTVAASATAFTGMIHIQFARAQLRVEGCADPATLQLVVELLSR